MWKCKHCCNEFKFETGSEKANHSRWCSSNPKRSEYANSLSRARDNITPQSRSRSKEAIALAHASGKYKNAGKRATETKIKNGTLGHTEETKQLLREKALASKHRRLVRSVRDYIRKDGTIVQLDSSWEEELAKRLDATNIEWIRPEEPIPYITSDGKKHNYFPDFYLTDYDIFLDPKNPAVVNAQKEKLDIILETIDNLKLLKSLEECKNFSI